MLNTFKNSITGLFGNKSQNDTKSKESEAKPDVNKTENEKNNNGLLNDFKNGFSFVGEAFSTVRGEFLTAKEKSKDLRQSNYNLGLKHLEKGDVGEAIFRFRLTKKFWPDFFDAYYQLAYCLVLKNKPEQAKEILEDLLQKNPNFDSKAHELLKQINSRSN